MANDPKVAELPGVRAQIEMISVKAIKSKVGCDSVRRAQVNEGMNAKVNEGTNAKVIEGRNAKVNEGTNAKVNEGRNAKLIEDSD